MTICLSHFIDIAKNRYNIIFGMYIYIYIICVRIRGRLKTKKGHVRSIYWHLINKTHKTRFSNKIIFYFILFCYDDYYYLTRLIISFAMGLKCHVVVLGTSFIERFGSKWINYASRDEGRQRRRRLWLRISILYTHTVGAH